MKKFPALALIRIGAVTLLFLCKCFPIVDDAPYSAKTISDLDRYVQAPDPDYSYQLIATDKGAGYVAYILDMKSGSWRNSNEVDRTLWQHQVTIVKPDNLTPGPSLLIIDGGDNQQPFAAKADGQIAAIAQLSGAITVQVSQIPNQPLTFANHDGAPHVEDGIMAFGWAQVMKTGDATWHARFPMVRAAVRAMDTAQKFMSSALGGKIAIDKFIVTGASKRGWATWLTGAVDKRVEAIVPIVADVLNTERMIRQHIESYGFWSLALYDYYYNNIFQHIGSPEMAALLKNEDPYFFRERLTMPKYLVHATGDAFFLPDGSQNYFGDLHGEKYLRYVPNAAHSLDGTDATLSTLAYVTSLRQGAKRPEFSWNFVDANGIRVKTKTIPEKVLLWQAHNPKARDFRAETLGKVWISQELQNQGKGNYFGSITLPASGYTAFMIELQFPGSLKFTTDVRVVPETRPFAGIDPRTGKLEEIPVP
jgi:PhoPQ-activated pathogenicity-related protein